MDKKKLEPKEKKDSKCWMCEKIKEVIYMYEDHDDPKKDQWWCAYCIGVDQDTWNWDAIEGEDY